MWPVTVWLLLCVSALLTVSSGLPNSSILFPDDDEGVAPRLISDRWAKHLAARRHGSRRSFYFPDETVATDSPAVIPDTPPDRPTSAAGERPVTPEHHLRPADGQQHSTDTERGVTDGPAVIPDTPSNFEPTTSDGAATLTPSDDADAVIEDRPVPRPSGRWPAWPPHSPDQTPDRTDSGTHSESDTEASTRPATVTPAEPATGGGSSSSDSSSGSGSGSSSGSGSGSSSSGSAILFPDSGLPPQPIPECGGELFHAYDNVTDDCQKLWTDDEAGCADGSWFVVNPESGDAACRPRPCPKDQTRFGDVCWPNKSNGTAGPCTAGQGVFVDYFGEGFCDCLARQVFWPTEDRCYPVYQRGPCPAGEHLVVLEGARHAVCRPTPCPDGQVFWGKFGQTPYKCYAVDDGEPNPCPAGGHLAIDIHTLEVKCEVLQLNAVFELPQVRCPKGSQLDFNGQCREELFQKFRSSFAVMPENRALCPAGFTASPDGRCINTDLTKPTGLGR